MPVTTPSTQIVYEATKELIVSGDLPGGSLLSENEVARRLGVSRTPAREAFVRLAAEGLLRLQPRRGAVVVPVTVGEGIDVLEVREALEVAAVRRLARRPQPFDLADARVELAQQRSAIEAADLHAFAASDHRFHLAIVQAGGNTVAAQLYATLGDRHRRMTSAAVGAELHRLGELFSQHRRLLTKAERADAEGFAAALRTHFVTTHRVLLVGA